MEDQQGKLRYEQEFNLDQIRLLGLTTGNAENFDSFFISTLVDQPTGAEGHEQNSDTQDDSGDKLEGERNTPSGFLLASASSTNELSSIVDPDCNGRRQYVSRWERQ